jgi:hypothetical protein
MSFSAEVMQRAYEADPNAMHSLVCIRVPCNQALADDPHVIVDRPPVLAGDFWQVGILGVLNGVLSANGLQKVAVKWSDEKDEDGRSKIVGFCDYDETVISAE